MTLLLFLLAEAIVPPSAFAPWFSDHGVTVSIARVSPGAPWVRAVAEVEAPPDRIFAAITDYDAYGETFAPYIARLAVLERSESSARLHLVWEYPFPYRDRDAVVLYRAARLEDGGYRLSWSGDSRPGDPSEGVRIGRVAGETVLEPSGATRTRLTYTFLGDLGGRFPRFAQEKAWRKEPLAYVLAIRRKLGLASEGGAS